ncbi:MAG: type II secretion system protein, partial [Planctomycetia bacterium]|nr:type II secretion system protein [Planctomycetia bacterium]
RGITLIELLAVLAVSSVMLAIAIGLIQTLLRASGVARSDLEEQNSVARLADAFRRDIHAATAFRAGPAKDGNPVEWTFDLGSGRAATYRVESGSLARTVLAGETLESQESFALPGETAVSVEMMPVGKANMVVLSTVSRAPSTGGKLPTAPGRAVRVEARLAADHRFEKSKEAR